jgi:hypothetical protein
MATWAWILIAVVIVVVAALFVAMQMRQRRTTMLRQRFGPEYDRTIEERDDRRAAEADLRDRQKERDRLDIKPLAEPTRARYEADWREIQERFVDQPSNAVVAADGLVYRVMAERGYPMESFEAQARLISVDHPSVVDNYRFAHRVRERVESEQASTEDLRGALLRYRSLFDELLQSDEAERPGDAESLSPDAADRDDRSQRSTQEGAR